MEAWSAGFPSELRMMPSAVWTEVLRKKAVSVSGLAMKESQNPWVEMKNTGRVSAAGLAVQSAAVGQSGLGAAQIGLGSENVITVLIRAGSWVVARTAPPAPCDRPTAATSFTFRRPWKTLAAALFWATR